MKDPRIDDEQIIDRYLAGQLSAEDEAAFEEHLFASQSSLEAVQYGESLRRGLEAVAEDERAVVATAGILVALRALRPWHVVAASLLLVAMLGVMTSQHLELRRLRAETVASGLVEPVASFAVVSLGMTRGSADSAVAIPRGERPLLLSLELRDVTARSYRVRLFDATDQLVWSADAVEPTLYDSLMIAVPATFLRSGSYRVEVTTSDGQDAGSFELDIDPG
ncbi:MAG: hypothetical protein AAGD38_20960 [Acidobacteriota bacterium]